MTGNRSGRWGSAATKFSFAAWSSKAISCRSFFSNDMRKGRLSIGPAPVRMRSAKVWPSWLACSVSSPGARRVSQRERIVSSSSSGLGERKRKQAYSGPSSMSFRRMF